MNTEAGTVISLATEFRDCNSRLEGVGLSQFVNFCCILSGEIFTHKDYNALRGNWSHSFTKSSRE